MESGITNGTNPAQAAAANGLPSAGTEGSVIQWWRWTFFAAALMLGFAGWSFTFAVHYGDHDPSSPLSSSMDRGCARGPSL